MSDELKTHLCEIAMNLNEKGLNHGATGNVSVRSEYGFYITPSGLANKDLHPDVIVELDFDGNKLNQENNLNPSSEWLFHKDLLKTNSAINAIVHTHSPYATAMSLTQTKLDSFHYMIAVAGGHDIRYAKYAMFGTQELSNNILEAMKDRRACIIANHGLVCAGIDLNEASDIAEEIEHLCQIYILANQVSKPNLLSKEDMSEVMNRFNDYSRWRKK
jgi:L-fuculose-phosphate aldolase